MWGEKLQEADYVPRVVVLDDWVDPMPKAPVLQGFADNVLQGRPHNAVTMPPLRRELPRFDGEGPAHGAFGDDLPDMTGWVTHLDHSYVAIQGPPGTGKSYRALAGPHRVVDAASAKARLDYGEVLASRRLAAQLARAPLLTTVVPGDGRPWGERILDTLQGGRECREVSQQDGPHGVALDPVKARRRIDLRPEIGCEEAVAFQPPRRHQDEHAEGGVAEPKPLRFGLGIRPDH
jgi:hypothetical protein